MPESDPVIDDPTYFGNIRGFFREIDIDHMAQKGMDIGTYDGVKGHAVQIYSAVTQKYMPPDAEGQWSDNRCTTFLNWISKGYKEGEPEISEAPMALSAAAASRVRKNAASLGSDEIEMLGRAFEGLMARDPSAPNSYFALAGLHGQPKLYCQHHNDPFNPWHRVYMKVFEDALRSVDGCGEVTLPYWDISQPMPAWFSQAPFAAYTFQRDLPSYKTGDQTQRYAQGTIDSNLSRFDFFADFYRALTQGRWGVYVQSGGSTGSGFQQWSIQAHDSGHVATGPTMANQSYASFDPIFWFYHCNLDRHWLSWQTRAGGLDWASFKSLLTTTTFWQAPLNVIQPFPQTTDQTIAFGIGYDELIEPMPKMKTQKGQVPAQAAFALAEDSDVAVHIEGIERLTIPGSFTVDLLADGERVASRAFFQPEEPKTCSTCEKIPHAGIEMRVPRDAIAGKSLTVNIEVPSQAESVGARFPMSQLGSPTVRVSIPLEED